MMNKTQSPRNRTWRYLLLLPALGLSAGLLSATAPVVTGRESGADKYLVIENNMVHGMVTRLTTDQDLADMKTALRAKGISTSYTRLKRNAAGEITYINFQAKNDHSGLDEESYTSPITTFFFYFGKDSTGVSISAIGETPMDITPKRLINRAVAESNGWMRGVTTDSTFRSRFPGGEDAYRKHLSKYIRYPRVCQENDIVGDVLIQYKIEPNGTITDVEVLKTPHQALGEEVKRVVSTFPSFKADPAGKTQLVTLCAGYMLESASGKVLEGEHDQTPDIQIIGYAVKK